MSSPAVERSSFLAVIVLTTAAFAWLLWPLSGALLWAIILAILFNPLYRRLLRHFGGRANLAAAISLLACVFIVIIPGAVVVAALAQEAAALYERVSRSNFDISNGLEGIRAYLPRFVLDALSTFDIGSLEELQQRLTAFLAQAAQFIASRALSIGQGTAQFFVSIGVMLYVLFFLFRDGSKLAVTIRRASPLNAHQTDHILGKFSAVVKATVKGNVIIALIQGAIGGIAFWALGIEAALLWGVLMAILSLLPAVGAFLVWGPASAYLMLSGQYTQGFVLLAVGILVISMIDNLLRPPLVGAGTKLPDYLILVSTLGGLSLFGLNGFVIGPLIAALFVAVWSLFIEDRSRATIAEKRSAERSTLSIHDDDR
ncbi:AI-2E family transporter [Hyphomicrobiales bacterium]|nr:AI-2E family transporter [Hyphomicrobiales bacterium]CAH1693018.1 AI-2E family transporter [Hyphomicrobiales bacterium]